MSKEHSQSDIVITISVDTRYIVGGNPMSDVKITVDAGVCRFKTIIEAKQDDEMNIVFRIKSECPKVREYAKHVEPIPMFDAVATPFCENVIYKVAGNYLEHVACPVPCAMVKASEAAADLALKKNVSFTIE